MAQLTEFTNWPISNQKYKKKTTKAGNYALSTVTILTFSTSRAAERLQSLSRRTPVPQASATAPPA